MEPVAAGPPRDPDFHPDPDGLVRPLVDHAAYMRLVANPFLALLLFVAGLWGVSRLARDAPQRVGPWLLIALALVVVGLAAYHSLQYHCLDCGHTGRLTRWRMHTCPRVSERWRQGRRRRLRGPTPGFQVLLWLYAALAAGVAALSLGWRPFPR